MNAESSEIIIGGTVPLTTFQEEMCKLNKAAKDEEKFATANVLQILRDSPYIGGFQVEIVYADKSKERRGGGCYSKKKSTLTSDQ
jgi:hypothetical protein